MIDLHFWPTPNGRKVAIFLEETDLAYRIVPVDIGRGDQFAPEFLRISPNNRIPAIVDHEPADGGPPISVFESGAILLYLGEKSGRFLPRELRARTRVTEWLMWQMAGLGPMMGQANHFLRYNPGKAPYAEERYGREVGRLFRVMNERLEGRAFLADEYSIADMASYPWAAGYQTTGIDLAAYPNVAAWMERIRERPAVQRAMAITVPRAGVMDEKAREILFGQR